MSVEGSDESQSCEVKPKSAIIDVEPENVVEFELNQSESSMLLETDSKVLSSNENQAISHDMDEVHDASTNSTDLLNILNDPVKWNGLGSETIDYILRNLKSQDIKSLDFSSSKRNYKNVARYATQRIFFTELKSGELKRKELDFFF